MDSTVLRYLGTISPSPTMPTRLHPLISRNFPIQSRQLDKTNDLMQYTALSCELIMFLLLYLSSGLYPSILKPWRGSLLLTAKGNLSTGRRLPSWKGVPSSVIESNPVVLVLVLYISSGLFALCERALLKELFPDENKYTIYKCSLGSFCTSYCSFLCFVPCM